jgi:hypothetical protein
MMGQIHWKWLKMLSLLLAIVCLVVSPRVSRGRMATVDEGTKASSPDEVQIAPNGISVPIGLILLARKDQDRCAIKFTKFWTGKTPDDEYATYESYYQGSQTGNFGSKNVKLKAGKLSRPRLRGIGRLSFSFGQKDIECGAMKFFWPGNSWVCFFNTSQKQGDYGIELAPTKWTDISQVNVFDPRLRWYRYDESRKDTILPVDRLWDDGPIIRK